MTSIRARTYCRQPAVGHKILLMRLVVFGEALAAGTRLTLFSADKPDRFFTVIKSWIDKTSGVALDLNTGVPSYQVDAGSKIRSSGRLLSTYKFRCLS